MKECWGEGALRAYLDRELTPEEMTRIGIHLGGCAQCHTRYNELAGRAARVTALMETLEVGPLVPAQSSVRRWKPVAAAWRLFRFRSIPSLPDPPLRRILNGRSQRWSKPWSKQLPRW
jgi:anti-sigma factor RsiW